MDERERISRPQAAFVMVGALSTSGSILIGHHFVMDVGREAWLAFTLGTVASLLTAALVAALGVQHPGRTIAEAAPRVLGRWLGGGVGMVYALYFLLAAVVTLRMAMEGLAFLLPRTPLLAMGLLLSAAFAYAAYGGLQVIARTGVLLLTLIVVMGIVLSLVAIPESDYAQLIPLFERGYRPLLAGTVHVAGLLGELAVFATVQGRLQGGASFRLNALILLLFLVATVGHVTGPIAVFGPELAGMLTVPVAAEVKVLTVADFLERLDSVGILLWLLALALKVPLFLYAAAVEAARVLRLRGYRPLLAPCGLALLLASVYAFADAPQVEEFLRGPYTVAGLSLGMGLPLVLVAAGAVRARARGRPGGRGAPSARAARGV